MPYLLYGPECRSLTRTLQTVQQVSTLLCLGDLYVTFAEFARQVASVILFNLTGRVFLFCFLINYLRSVI